jgi:hypothetical protein
VIIKLGFLLFLHAVDLKNFPSYLTQSVPECLYMTHSDSSRAVGSGSARVVFVVLLCCKIAFCVQAIFNVSGFLEQPFCTQKCTFQNIFSGNDTSSFQTTHPSLHIFYTNPEYDKIFHSVNLLSSQYHRYPVYSSYPLPCSSRTSEWIRLFSVQYSV